MTTTAKICVIEPKGQEIQATEEKAAGTATSEKSSYVTVDETNTWKTITSPTPVSDLVNGLNGIEEQPAYKGPKDAIMSNMFVDKPKSKKELRAEHDLPFVPDFYDLTKGNPHLLDSDNIGAVRDRYKAIKMTLKELRKNALATLKNIKKQPLTTDEIKSLQVYIEDLNTAIAKAQSNCEKAEYYIWQNEMWEQKEKVET